MKKRPSLISALFLATAILLSASCSQNASQTQELISPESLSEQLQNSPNTNLVDLRSEEEYLVGHIEGAQNVPFNANEFLTLFTQQYPNKQEPVILYCLSGSQTTQALQILTKAGYQAQGLQQGVLSWRNQGYDLKSNMPESMQSVSVKALFEQSIQGEQLVLVDFYADWCRPCKMMEPDIKRIEEEYKGQVTVLKIDVDTELELAERYNIQSIPTLMLFKNNQELYYNAGLHNYGQLVNLISQNL